MLVVPLLPNMPLPMPATPGATRHCLQQGEYPKLRPSRAHVHGNSLEAKAKATWDSGTLGNWFLVHRVPFLD